MTHMPGEPWTQPPRNQSNHKGMILLKMYVDWIRAKWALPPKHGYTFQTIREKNGW